MGDLFDFWINNPFRYTERGELFNDILVNTNIYTTLRVRKGPFIIIGLMRANKGAI